MLRDSKMGIIVGLVALALLLALLVFAFTKGRGAAAPAGAAAAPVHAEVPQGSLTESVPELRARPGEVTAVIQDVVLSPQARLLAERFQCVCGCKDILATCTCDKTPGSRDMKQHLQQLVDAGKSPAEVESAMVARYGAAVLP